MEILVGSTGFVGSHLKRSHHFDLLCHSNNIEEAYSTHPDLLVYAGIPAQKFIANQNAEQDLKVIEEAISNIQKIAPKKLVLISTIDVFHHPKNITEMDLDHFETEEAYGRNRRKLEEWVIENVEDYLIVRLPGLYGKKIKKNFIYDLISYIPSMLKEEKLFALAKTNPKVLSYYEKGMNDFYQVKKLSWKEREEAKQVFKECQFSALNFTDSRGLFQFYNLAYLWKHIEIALQNHLKIVHLATEPIQIQELYRFIYKEDFVNELPKEVPYYCFKTQYDTLFSGENGFIFNRDFLLEDIKKFVLAEQEPRIKLAISNLAWEDTYDDEMYRLLEEKDIPGLEIAPTRICQEAPYAPQNVQKAKNLLKELQEKYRFQVVSMQSIWYGHGENLFESKENYALLKDYTKQAILYAEQIGCRNLVFGCPKNRSMPNREKNLPLAIQFFNEIGDFAHLHHTVIALEPNPVIYHTNFLNTTEEAIAFIKQLKTKGVLLNYDLGTVIENQESLTTLKENIDMVSHIHISEPHLKEIERRKLHQELFQILKAAKYENYVSIEMGKTDKKTIEETLDYVIDLSERSSQ